MTPTQIRAQPPLIDSIPRDVECPAERMVLVPSSSKYDDFVAAKLGIVQSAGIDAPMRDYALFPHQRDLTSWALRRGRAAIFADTGLGKMRMAIAWADMVCSHTGRPVIILCPLAVAQQFVAEGVLMGIEVTHCRESHEVRRGINITNYDRMHKFDMSASGGVALDESSIIKSHSSKTLALLMEAFRSTHTSSAALPLHRRTTGLNSALTRNFSECAAGLKCSPSSLFTTAEIPAYGA